MTFVAQLPSSMQPIEQKAASNRGCLPQISVEVNKLPSKSLAYPRGAKIRYRPYTFGEVKQVSQTKNISDDEKFEFVLQGVETNFSKDLLTVSDVLFLGVLRKISTFGSAHAGLMFPCPCGARIKHKLEIDKLEFDDIEAPRLPVIADLDSGVSLEFTPMTVKRFQELMAHEKHDDEIMWFAAQVQNMSMEDAYTAIFNASPFDRETLEEVDKILYHGIAPVNLVCESCGQKHKVEMDGETSLILPFRLDEGVARTRVRFGS